MSGFQIIRIFNSAAEGAIPAAISLCVIVAIFAGLIAAAATGIDLIGWE